MSEASAINPAVFDWNGLEGLPRFDLVADTDYAPAFDVALQRHDAEIDGIANNPAAPDFANTIIALETAGDDLSRVSALFWNRTGSHSNDVIQALEREMAPRMSRHYSRINQNAALFARVDALWENRDDLGLTLEEMRVLERHWKGFVQCGARLPKAQQERLAALSERLATLSATFGQNVLADEKSWSLFLSSPSDLDGLPEFLKDAMASAADERGQKGKYAVTLSRSIVDPFLTFSTRRDLREQAFNAWVARGLSGGTTDNRDIIRETLSLRAEFASLIGYKTYADFKLNDTMAKTPANVDALLMQVWGKAVERARQEEKALAALAAEDGHNHAIMPWDWRFYAEKLRTRTFDFSEAELKPYLQLEKIIAACFDVAQRLFGITARQVAAPAYHPDVRVYEMRDRDGKLFALFLGDYFARSSKRSGAWMSAFQSQHRLPLKNGSVGELPIIYNVCNFAKPAEGKPALLSLEDARTLFHEFGHALHGMLSNVTYPSVSGTGVSRDFVELPSQLYEHWLTVPQVLKTYAVHVETGEPIPQALLDKVLAARTFNSGFATVEFTASALVDMAFHAESTVEDPIALQEEVLKSIGLPESIVMRHSAPHFSHIFNGGYAAGYYSYMWSEVLDADAFAAFEETGDVFNPVLAARLRENIYSSGGSMDPEDAYRAFRGQLPSPDAMLVKKGLAKKGLAV